MAGLGPVNPSLILIQLATCLFDFLPLKANSLFGLLSFPFHSVMSFGLAGCDFLLTYCTNKMHKQFSGCQLLIFNHEESLCWMSSGGLKIRMKMF